MSTPQPAEEVNEWEASLTIPGEPLPPIERDRHIEHRTVGPPGTGKTTWLSKQAKNAVAKYGPGEVGISSLTKAAAAEIGGRDTGIPPERIGTLHAHAYRALDKPKLAETPEGIKLWNAECGSATWRLTGRGADLDTVSTDAMFGVEGDALLNQLNVERALLKPREEWPPAIQQFGDRWERFKDEHGFVDFTDLIEDAQELSRMPGDPAILMVDEAQDMSSLEMQLVRKWGEGAEQLVIVGDPDQSLYTWRGADPVTVFGEDPDALRILSQSYRIPAAVHEAAVSMIERIPGRLPIEYAPKKDQDGKEVAGKCAIADLSYRDPEPIVHRIGLELAKDPERTVMVLATCGYMLNGLIGALREKGVPFHNPYRLTQGAWNPLNGAGRLLAYLKPAAESNPKGEGELWTWADLKYWTEPLMARGVLKRGMKGYIELKASESRTTRATAEFGMGQGDVAVPVPHLLDLFEEDALDKAMDLDVEWWHAHLRHAERKRHSFSASVYRQHGAPALWRQPRVILGTVHSVKGGEADTVILLPDLSSAGYWNGIKTIGEAHDSVIRQFYVGMTRAKDTLLLARASGGEAVTW